MARQIPQPGAIPWWQLTDASLDTIEQVAIPCADGYSYREIAGWLGIDHAEVLERMARLRADIRLHPGDHAGETGKRATCARGHSLVPENT
jgi:hypothetical protein